VKISMPQVIFIRRKSHDRSFAVAEAIRQSFSLSVVPGTFNQFATKSSGKTHANFVSEMTVNSPAMYRGAVFHDRPYYSEQNTNTKIEANLNTALSRNG
jgi:hypothetical protein